MINDLYIQATNRSPEVCLSASGRIRISGRCIPENPDEYFAPVMDWVSRYCEEPAEETVIEASIDYINGTNQGKMFWLLTKLKGVTASGKKMVINFTYEADDDHMCDLGLYWAEILKMPVNMIPVETLDLPEMKRPPAVGNTIPPAE